MKSMHLGIEPLSSYRLKPLLQYMRRYAIFLILAIFFSCELTKPKYEPEPNVVAILNTSLERQKVFVGRSYEISEVPDTSDWCGISNALVKISYDTIVVTFHELADTPGVYISESLPVEPLETYYLEVIYPDDKKVTGKTILPGAFMVTTPINGDTVKPEQELKWEESLGAASYFIYYKADSLYNPDFPEYFWSREDFKDLGLTTSVVFSSLCDGYGKLAVQIWACDSNYYDYYKAKWGREPIESYVHLTGGLGVFGSFTVTDSITVILRE